MDYKLIEKGWWNSAGDFNINMKKYDFSQKKQNEERFNKIVDKICNFINSMPKEKEKQEKWVREGKKNLYKLMKKDTIFKINYIDENTQKDIINSTEDFIKRAKQFNDQMTPEDIGQAMRNVWIVNLLQCIFKEKVNLNDAIFGYSMLYPYTDNYLDNVEIDIKEKVEFTKNLTLRLKGNKISARNEYEDKVFSLIEMIEKFYSREEYPKVYESLLEIQEGQIDSLKQQDGKIIPYEKNILGISIKKGASSVLVDGSIVRGNLSYDEELLCLGYGFILQIGDDLQDVEEDIKNNHMTIMSQIAYHYPLDVIVNKLINFTETFFDNDILLKENNRLKELIKNNCLMLILFSAVLSKEFFSKNYIKAIEEYLPFNIKYIENLKNKFKNKIKFRKEDFHENY